MRRASAIAIIVIAALPVFGLLAFPILYRLADNYIDYLTESSPFQMRSIQTDDFNDYEPDLTLHSFHHVTEEELAHFPQVKEGIEYFEGRRDHSSLSNAKIFCDIYPDCVVWVQVKNTEWQSLWNTFEFDQCHSAIEYNERYYSIACIPGHDRVDRPEAEYGFWIMMAGIPAVLIIWQFHKWNAMGKRKISQ